MNRYGLLLSDADSGRSFAVPVLGTDLASAADRGFAVLRAEGALAAAVAWEVMEWTVLPGGPGRGYYRTLTEFSPAQAVAVARGGLTLADLILDAREAA